MSVLWTECSDAIAGRQAALREEFLRVRQLSVAMVDGLNAEDCMVQSMPDASPVKWHLAHLTWFFETFVLEPSIGPAYVPFDPSFRVLFNSYYVGVGEQHPRGERGLVSRPSLERVLAYRQVVDERIASLMASRVVPDDLLDVIQLGLHHEHQHQELILTDLKHHLWKNPLRPVYREAHAPLDRGVPPMTFVERPEGVAQIGAGDAGFAFDNERPRHRVWLASFAIATRTVTCGEYLAFIDDGGYHRPEYWLSEGWDVCMREGWEAPLYWQQDADGGWALFTLNGMRAMSRDEPVSHVSFLRPTPMRAGRARACRRRPSGSAPPKCWVST